MERIARCPGGCLSKRKTRRIVRSWLLHGGSKFTAQTASEGVRMRMAHKYSPQKVKQLRYVGTPGRRAESWVVPAWISTWYLVKLAVSAAKSVSRMTDSAAVVLSSVVRRLLAVDSNVCCWKAPMRPRRLLMSEMAWSITFNESCAPAAEVMLM